MSCAAHSLTRPIQRGSNARHGVTDEDTFQFITELSLLIDTTYFIGTFSSKVGVLVKLLRSCPEGNDPTHYYQSYGVDRHYFWLCEKRC